LRTVLSALRTVVLGAAVLMVWLGLRDAQRAEYLADELAARAAGSTDAVGLVNTLTQADSTQMVVRREARRGHGVVGWRTAAAQVCADGAANLPRLRQLSVRGVRGDAAGPRVDLETDRR
jgi:hypothetical protein